MNRILDSDYLIQAAKPRCGLPELVGRKRACEDDNASTSDMDDAASSTCEHQTKIPCKVTDMTDSFSVGNERTAYVQGWQPIPGGLGAFITIPKSFKDKIWRNKFFSYRELHREMNKSNSGNLLKSFFDKLIEEDESSSTVEKDHIRLLELVIMQMQFFAL